MGLLTQTLLHDINRAPTTYGPLGPPTYDLPSRTAYDVAIVGGGLAGLVTAAELCVRGKSVVVFEAGRVGEGPSGRNGGQLWPGFSIEFSEMAKSYGFDKTAEAWQLAHESMTHLHARLKLHPTRCGYRPGTFMAAYDKADALWCEQEVVQMHAANLSYAQYVPAPLMRKAVLNSAAFEGGILYSQPYGHFNPLQHVKLLAAQIRASDGDVIERARVTAIEERPALGGYAVIAGRARTLADVVILAGGAEFKRPAGISRQMLPVDSVPVQTAILASTPFSPALAEQLFPGGVCFADTRHIGHNYGRIAPCEDGSGQVRLLFGGADALMQSRATAAYDITRIRADIYKTFPLLAQHKVGIETVWGGRESLPSVTLPAVRSLAPNLYSLANFYGQGNTLSALTGQALAEQITQGHSRAFNLLSELSDSIRPVLSFRPLAQLKFAYDLYLKPQLDSLRRGPN
jgi:gamma-glutamylputrescine oxidase